MTLNKKKHQRSTERRRKRLVMPLVYFFIEVIMLWLIVGLIQGSFNIFEWIFLAIAIFIFGVIYSVFKTVNIYQRQKDYLTEKEYRESEKRCFSGDP